MGPYEAFLSGKPVITTIDAGGPLDVVHDRDGPRRRAGAGGGRAGGGVAARPPDEAAAFGGREGARRRGDLGSRDREAALVKVAYFSPMPPETSGIADYSALLVPALARARRPRGREAGHERPPRGVDLAVYHIGNDPEAHGWIVDALRRAPGARRPARLRPPPPRRRDDHRAARRARLPRRDGARDGVVGRLLGHAVIEKRIPPLWETRPEDFPLAGEVLDARDRADRPLALRRRSCAGRGVRGPDRARPASRLAGARRRAGRRRGRAARSARSATSTRASACRSCSRRSPASARAPAGAAPARRRHLAGLRPRPPAPAARARRRRASCARGTSTSGGSGR